VGQGIKSIALIGPTAADVRDVMIEGTSGILAVSWALDTDITGRPMGIPVYEPTKRRVTWANGAMATGFSAQEPDRLRDFDDLPQSPFAKHILQQHFHFKL
jgi:phage terminase large subunit-like protein